ncbi:hypothetical protein BDZ90DRAFT_231202 [Jaminaea rosea]|uniref:BTB domain-containing protein n=1 Tax=Jaminaea rosea TaxID=1569628 RepID=A0A316UVG5_9BASI|nr:hypothetical protein BDZ90DRAFT_231202 [Jaminaea rosea]PWN29222.1 hypothetical protein BDZ90DRAFT_231202 [Jaminaea rosea]
MAPSHTSGASGVPTLIDCWHVRDLQRFRAVLKGGPAAAGLVTGSSSHSYSKSPSHSAGGASWGSLGNSSNGLGPAAPGEVNRKDHLGRTALHHIASSEEGVSIDFLHALLSHPSCNPNAQDGESGWTALHRALYLGNLNHALTLLRHPNIDVRIKDFENLTPFDLYNSTVAGTNPPLDGNVKGDLYLWGSNRNYTLGLGDADDRSWPDLVTLKRQQVGSAAIVSTSDSDDEDANVASNRSLAAGRRFDRVKVRDIQMSRMHTVVVTEEKGGGNVWVAGIGTAGRLGRAASPQTTLTPLPDFKERAISVAVGPDHTLIVTASGAVYSFGSNKFGVLGYTLEEGQGMVASSGGSSTGSAAASATFGGHPPAASNKSYDIQMTPRKLVGPLKKESVVGVAASKLHSVAFTEDALFTWGSNTGQLGYDKVATPLQVLPRRVTSLTAGQATGIRQVTCTDHATALLLNTYDVLVFHGDMSFRVTFPMARFNEKMSAGVFRPPQAQPKPSIAKLTSSGSTFAALSDYGDLFTFTLEHPSEYNKGSATPTSGGGAKRVPAPEPQLVWSVRKKFTAVRDVAIGLDGSIILSTSSGHVFVRSRRTASEAKSSSKSGSARAFKFAQIPMLQRVVRVATNESGGFAAIRSQAPIREIKVKGRTLQEDLLESLPHLKTRGTGGEQKLISADVGALTQAVSRDDEAESDEESDVGDTTIQRHTGIALLITEAAKRWDRDETGQAQPHFGAANLVPPPGTDMFLIAGGKYLPAHRAILSARIPRLSSFLDNPPTKGAGGAPNGVVVKKVSDSVVTLTLPSCSFHTGLFLLHYLYTDDLPAVWTSSVGLRVEKQFAQAKINRNTVHAQLKELASVLALPALTPVLNSPVPRSPTPTLREDMASFFKGAVTVDIEASPLHDVELLLSDRTVPAHSVLLRRSPFFTALLHPDWTSTRWSLSGVLTIDMGNIRWETMAILLSHIYADKGLEAFTGKEHERTQDDWFDFVTEVLAGSNELLLDRLKLAASSLLRARMAPQNIGALLSIADMYHAVPLKEASLLYCAQNLEGLLEGGMLDELEHKMIRELSAYMKARQDDKTHRTRRTEQLSELLVKHHEFFEGLDVPPPSLNLVSHRVGKRPPRSTPLEPYVDGQRKSGKAGKGKASSRASPPPVSPSLAATLAGGSGNDSALFDMDEDSFEGLDGSSLGAMANLSLGQRGGSGAAWTTVRRQPSNAAESSSAQQRSASSSTSAAAGGTTPSPSAGLGQDLRSIMAAEQARSHPLRRMLSASASASQQQTPEGSMPPSGAATPVRPRTANRPSVSAAGEQSPSLGPATNSADEPPPLVSPLNVSTKLSQRDRKKAAMLAAAQAQQVQASSSPSPAADSSSQSPAPAWGKASSSSTDSSARPVWQMNKTGSSVNATVESADVSGTSPIPSTPSRPTASGYSRPSLMGSAGRGVSSFDLGGSARRQPLTSTPSRDPFPTPGSAASPSSFLTSPPPSASGSHSPHRSTSPLPSTSPSSSSLSFAQIQAQQQHASALALSSAAADIANKKKSFAQIQAEERAREEERRKEEKERVEFERWFEEETRRQRAEEKKAQVPKGPKAGGKGRKGGGAQAAAGEDGSASTRKKGGGDGRRASSAAPVAGEQSGSNGAQSGRGKKKGPGTPQGQTDAASVEAPSATDEPSQPPRGPRRQQQQQQQQQRKPSQPNSKQANGSGGIGQSRGPVAAPAATSAPSAASLSAKAPEFVFKPAS